MFEHLRLRPIRAFAGVDLIGLGKITIICGRNNSGKSTILEAITDKDTSVGKALTADQIEAYAEESVQLSQGSQYHNVAAQIESHIKGVFAKKKIWFKNDRDEFYSALQKIADSIHPYSIRVPSNRFDSFFPDKISTALITAKRKLETQSSTNAINVKFDATGALSELYWLKNKSPGTQERGFYDTVLDAFKTLSEGYLFNVTQGKQSDIHLEFSNDNKSWYAAPDCGLGLQELLIVLFFCHATSYNLILIEELENHLHPRLQKMLLRHLSTVNDKQFIISTHSSALLDTSIVDRIFFVTNSGKVEINEVTNRAEVLKNLGYSISDNIVSDLVILVEGPSDTPVVEEFLIKRGLIPKFDIKIWPLGGDIMHFHDLQVFKQNYKTVALIDSDPGSAKVRQEFLAKCAELKIPAVQLKRYSIENYFTLNVLRNIFGVQIPASVQSLDPKTKLESQIGINVKANNRKIAKAMALEEMRGTDFEGFLDLVEKECKTKL